jgi:hypothetical protein
VRHDFALRRLVQDLADVTAGRTRAQREIDAKTNEIPELEHVTAGLDLSGTVSTLDALHTQSETARRVTKDEHGHYLMIIKANQPSLLETPYRTATSLTGDPSRTSITARYRCSTCHPAPWTDDPSATTGANAHETGQGSQASPDNKVSGVS